MLGKWVVVLIGLLCASMAKAVDLTDQQKNMIQARVDVEYDWINAWQQGDQAAGENVVVVFQASELLNLALKKQAYDNIIQSLELFTENKYIGDAQGLPKALQGGSMGQLVYSVVVLSYSLPSMVCQQNNAQCQEIMRFKGGLDYSLGQGKSIDELAQKLCQAKGGCDEAEQKQLAAQLLLEEKAYDSEKREAQLREQLKKLKML